MPAYKLYYFNGRGRAETARILFSLAGAMYEDVRYEREVWPKHKEEMPYGQVPVLEVDGKKLAQSSAIYQYLAKQFGFNGKDDWEAAQIQELLGTIDDFFSHFRSTFAIQDENEKKKAIAAIVTEHGEPYLKRLQRKLEANKSGYFVGKELTVADIALMDVLSAIKTRFAPGVVEKYPKLNEFEKKISGQPKIKAWIDKRPKTDF